jgi:hypothetical protein
VIHSTDLFMDALEKWLKAARADDFATARGHAEDLVKNAQMLVNNPDFVGCFKIHHADVEPVNALLGMCQFLVCATHGRAVVLKTACKTLAEGHGGSE